MRATNEARHCSPSWSPLISSLATSLTSETWGEGVGVDGVTPAAEAAAAASAKAMVAAMEVVGGLAVVVVAVEEDERVGVGAGMV